MLFFHLSKMSNKIIMKYMYVCMYLYIFWEQYEMTYTLSKIVAIEELRTRVMINFFSICLYYFTYLTSKFC